MAKKKRRLAKPKEVLSRRRFAATGAGLLTGGLALGAGLIRTSPASAENPGPPVRPPTASHDDASFRRACIRCGLCGTVCENGCIRFFPFDEPGHGALTPYLDVRRRSCTLCMRCTVVCPTGALKKVDDDLKEVAKSVNMGIAKVDPDRCISYLGRLCGYCHDACPLPSIAIKLVPPAKPVVLAGCVGCGRCVELCPANPTAIYVEAAQGNPTRPLPLATLSKHGSPS